MRFRYSIRVRFIIILMVFSIVIAFLFTAIVVYLQRSIVEDFYRQRLTSELRHFTARYQSDSRVLPPGTQDLTAFLGPNALPPHLRKAAVKLPDGIHYLALDGSDWREGRRGRSRRDSPFELDGDREGASRFIMGITTLPDQQRLFLLVDRHALQTHIHEMERHIFWALMLVCVVGVVLALLMARRVTSPLKQLATVIETSGPDNLPTGFSQLFRPDEFGTLARALERSMERVKAFMAREHQFTRDASHELRTPVTVIKGALELFRMTPAAEDTMTKRLLDRVERSVIDMESTIESLLWLARENSGGKERQPCRVLPVVEHAVEQNRHLVAGKPVAITFTPEAEPVVMLPPGVLAIAVSNLIRNACQFTAKGTIAVILYADRVTVTDTGCGIDNPDLKQITTSGVSSTDSPGFGFGLDIVTRLCDQFGWQLTIESTPGQGTSVQLVFSPGEAETPHAQE